VEVAWPAFMHTNSLVDDSGNSIPVQKLASGKMGFVASDVPANGKITCKQGPQIKADTISNPAVAFSIDDKTGAISNLELNGDKNHISPKEYSGLGAAIYVKGLDPVDHFFTIKQQSGFEDNGPVIRNYITNCILEGTNGVIYQLSTINGSNYLKLAVTIDKEAILNKEAIHIAFPFNYDDPEVKIGIDSTYITPEKGQLPGANKDFYSVQRWLDISGKNGAGVTISSPEAALFEVGGMVDEREINNGVKLWKTENHSSATVFAYVMNNYWHTNYKATQEGKVTFNFYLRFHNAFDLAGAERFAAEATQPLLGYLQ
jgi:alpha-mannosidase